MLISGKVELRHLLVKGHKYETSNIAKIVPCSFVVVNKISYNSARNFSLDLLRVTPHYCKEVYQL